MLRKKSYAINAINAISHAINATIAISSHALNAISHATNAIKTY